ncbi:MAG TPA: carbonic anhydrase [Candidatus Krumholzibacteria bacterium]|nr:carbonic anhydrase [Candidatus Krumholzibacteria bacterium]
MNAIVRIATVLLPAALLAAALPAAAIQPAPAAALALLKDGNARFAAGKATHPHADAVRLKQAGTENQGNYAYATVLSCSDSRVPVEMIFDAGIMDIFVVRVAGNVCDTDEIGTIEYGLAHVNTPVLVVLGHTQCGAVTAVTHAARGQGHELELNIPPLVDNIGPAVQRALAAHPEAQGDAVIPYAIEENVWQAVADLFRRSPVTRQLVHAGKVRVVGAVYDVGTGAVTWLPGEKVEALLRQTEADKSRETEVYAH